MKLPCSIFVSRTLRQNLTATETQRMTWKAALTKRGENTPRLAKKNISLLLLNLLRVDGMMARGSKIFFGRLSDKLASKMGQTLHHYYQLGQTEIEFCHPKGHKSLHKRN